MTENAVLVGVAHRGQPEVQLREYLDELAFLADTAGATCVRIFTQNLDYPDPRTYVGSGKLKEISDYVIANGITLIIFDDELSPSQLKNIERSIDKAKIKILDRTNLILDIFASRARTAQSKTQVELAQYKYLLPRLTRMWTHLERQQGGIGMRGPGESEIETDRRVIRDKLARLKERLKEIDKQNATQRKNRGELVRVALVGYTNVGKSTLMTLLSKSEVFSENKLFATLDTTVRKVVLENVPFLLSDTVGFIRKLPHDLVESFKSTLDEVREADILLHVVDISHPHFADHIRVVKETLLEIKAADKPTLLIFNKIDAYKAPDITDEEPHIDSDVAMTLEQLKQSWIQKESADCVFISAVNRENINELRHVLAGKVRSVHLQRYPNYILPPYQEEEFNS